MSMEIELKLLVAREDLDRVLGAQAVKRRAQGRAQTIELMSVYYDTPELDLHNERLALRLRRIFASSAEHWLQALKGGAASAAGLTEREEYEWPVPGQSVDLALLDATPYGPVFARRNVREALGPVFTTRFTRTRRQLALAEGAQAELCVDVGEIRAGNRRAPICEVEIELKSGSLEPMALFGFAAELLQEVPFRLGAVSKAERGYALYRNAPPRPPKAIPVVLRPDMSPAQVLQTVARGCLAQIHANEEGFLAGRDPEFLHHLRVGFRRLRVALAMPEDTAWRAALEPLREETRWLFSVLGPVRNWDVFLTETLTPLMRHLGTDSALAALRSRCLRLRRRHFALAREAVGSPRYCALLLSLGMLLYKRPFGRPAAELSGTSAPALAFGHTVIARRDRTLRKRGEALAGASPEERHRARIAAKKLRYCAEFFIALYPQKKVRRYVDALADLQDALGLINDAAGGAAVVTELGSGGRVDPRVIGIVQGWIVASEARAIEHLSRAWDEFEACRRYWD
jgi:inorganic triphosphatase YgiF